MNNETNKDHHQKNKSTEAGLQSATQGVLDQAKQVAGEVTEKVTEQAKEKLNSTFDTTKDKAAGSIGSVADALRASGRTLRAQDAPLPVEYVDRAADQIEKVGSYLRGRTLGQLFGDAERFARREPAIFLGGAFTLGLLAGRFLKSSDRHDETTTEDPMGMRDTLPGGSGTQPGKTSYGSTASHGSTDYGDRDRSYRPGGSFASPSTYSTSTAAKPTSGSTNTTGGAGGASTASGSASSYRPQQSTTATTTRPDIGGSGTPKATSLSDKGSGTSGTGGSQGGMGSV